MLYPPDRADDGESPSATPPEQETNARDTGNTIQSDEERRALDAMGRVRDEYERTGEKHAAGMINDDSSPRPRR
jgi:hypothetical protein